ncbi:MAG: hypothetical protein COV55_02510 [Candidatus Komeilibacteria bacterium CG11_big_fil_rev_8_21_14_0_20_36_20]|uniref:Uncharacterized protein n=1 Tax=Candidatus Komeilibacteria bacterium CG11_big_fil_rev_8_21_14_0_20_36_20 TaxID=1974477 RepID=A0A2H0ND57_9BACT|nr:MAG: hypothetical protein COV55_02510 [Candidatus Komeilibacteria bacterium CG11_big_fil_rev_8_21_14_0_20_36_20]PIR81846.1 MAG: hypothetical protein COU21_01570 [Candidatus Komeilibacteria bacterium CG10_big_fil_rev_8_21_14_0_10_36_65]PJC55337.1 MAG: hypothetical protein CO027_02910 [Candidatus Komeilibacteria bacterium CG_4_9_14_0_2_um_filter_36_13]
MLYLKNPSKNLIHKLIGLIITTLIIPLVIIDVWTEVYHRTCFPLYKMPYVKRKNYIRIDRHKLKYLNFWQKIYCVYCGYANGLLSYLVAIGAKTEKYWCGIKHKKDKNFIPPKHHQDFAEYNNQEDFNKKYKN